MFDQEAKYPFGFERLKAVELFYQIVRLGKQAVNVALNETKIFGLLLNLIHAHPWNNLLQLKTH